LGVWATFSKGSYLDLKCLLPILKRPTIFSIVALSAVILTELIWLQILGFQQASLSRLIGGSLVFLLGRIQEREVQIEVYLI